MEETPEPDNQRGQEFEDLIDRLSGRKQRAGHVPVRLKRARQERNMRSTHKMMRDIKRKNTLIRASKPRTKQSRHQQQPKRKPKHLRLKLPDVECEHEKVVQQLAEEDAELLRAYTDNYHQFIMLRARAVAEANAKDEEEERERKDYMERKRLCKDKNDHKKSFIHTLRDLVQDHEMAISEDSPPAPPVSGHSLKVYFGNKNGKHLSRVNREWKELYHDKVKVARQPIREWPHTIEEKKRDLEAKEKKKAVELRCGDCHINLVINHKEANLICPGCGLISPGGDGIQFQVTFAQQQSSSRGPAPYDRLAHVSILYFLMFRAFLLNRYRCPDEEVRGTAGREGGTPRRCIAL